MAEIVKLYIDGAWRDGAGSQALDFFDPATGQAIGAVAVAGRDDLELLPAERRDARNREQEDRGEDGDQERDDDRARGQALSHAEIETLHGATPSPMRRKIFSFESTVSKCALSAAGHSASPRTTIPAGRTLSAS